MRKSWQQNFSLNGGKTVTCMRLLSLINKYSGLAPLNFPRQSLYFYVFCCKTIQDAERNRRQAFTFFHYISDGSITKTVKLHLTMNCKTAHILKIAIMKNKRGIHNTDQIFSSSPIFHAEWPPVFPWHVALSHTKLL